MTFQIIAVVLICLYFVYLDIKFIVDYRNGKPAPHYRGRANVITPLGMIFAPIVLIVLACAGIYELFL